MLNETDCFQICSLDFKSLGCTILESINHMLERGSKDFGSFFDVRKAFDTVWIDSLFYKLFTEFDIRVKCSWPLKTCTISQRSSIVLQHIVQKI